MKTSEQLNIYECFDQKGDPVKFICDGHVDSTIFRDRCFEDYFVKPMVIRHQWQKTRKSFTRKTGKKFVRSVTETIDCPTEEMGATPITIGLI